MPTQSEFVRNGIKPDGGVRALIGAFARGNDAVLGIVAETQGSTYRKVGALLLRGVDMSLGFLSGGCLEPEFDEAARTVRLAQQARWWSFNTSSDDDLLFGSASGCRGLMRLLLVPIQREHALYAALLGLMQSSTLQRLQLQLQIDGGGHAMLGEQQWEWPGNPLCVVSGHAPQWPVGLQIAAPPQVLLAGCGPEAAPLIRHLHQLGARVSAIEHRGRWALHAAAADTHCAAVPEAAWEDLRADVYTAALVMGHHYGNDLAHLRRLAATRIPYIGLLGPPARRDALLADLGDTAELLATRLHAPVGLHLGGDGPEAIALSVAAQLLRHFSGVGA